MVKRASKKKPEPIEVTSFHRPANGTEYDLLKVTENPDGDPAWISEPLSPDEKGYAENPIARLVPDTKRPPVPKHHYYMHLERRAGHDYRSEPLGDGRLQVFGSGAGIEVGHILGLDDSYSLRGGWSRYTVEEVEQTKDHGVHVEWVAIVRKIGEGG